MRIEGDWGSRNTARGRVNVPPKRHYGRWRPARPPSAKTGAVGFCFAFLYICVLGSKPVCVLNSSGKHLQALALVCCQQCTTVTVFALLASLVILTELHELSLA